MKRHIFGGICQVLFRKKWGDFNYEQRKSLEKSRLRIPRRYAKGRGESTLPFVYSKIEKRRGYFGKNKEK